MNKSILQALPKGVVVPPQYVKLLLHGNGAAGGTSFPDNSFVPKVITPAGSVTTQPNPDTSGLNGFDASSILFTLADNQYLTAPAGTDFALGTGDFTLELFAYHTAYTGDSQFYFDTRASGGATAGAYFFLDTATQKLGVGTGTGGTLGLSDDTVSLNAWHHIAFVRTSGQLGFYLDGNFSGLVPLATDLTENGCTIGDTFDHFGNLNLSASINQLRLVKDYVYYFGPTIPVPTSPFPNAG